MGVLQGEGMGIRKGEAGDGQGGPLQVEPLIPDQPEVLAFAGVVAEAGVSGELAREGVVLPEGIDGEAGVHRPPKREAEEAGIQGLITILEPDPIPLPSPRHLQVPAGRPGDIGPEADTGPIEEFPRGQGDVGTDRPSPSRPQFRAPSVAQ